MSLGLDVSHARRVEALCMIITNETAFVLSAHGAEARSLFDRLRDIFVAKPAYPRSVADGNGVAGALPWLAGTQDLVGGVRLDVAEAPVSSFASTRRRVA